MVQSGNALLLLSARPANPFGGRVESADEWFETVAIFDPLNCDEPEGYAKKEIRAAIKLYHHLPDTIPVKIDLYRVYAHLGREWQDVFDLYASGFKLDQIAKYWRGLWAGKRYSRQRSDRHLGSDVVDQLVDRVRWLLSLRLERVPLGADRKP